MHVEICHSNSLCIFTCFLNSPTGTIASAFFVVVLMLRLFLASRLKISPREKSNLVTTFFSVDSKLVILCYHYVLISTRPMLWTCTLLGKYLMLCLCILISPFLTLFGIFCREEAVLEKIYVTVSELTSTTINY